MTLNKPVDRRTIFRTIGSTTAIAAAALPLAGRRAKAYDPGEEETRARYDPDSPNVQAFYRTNGYETLKQ